ncbi:tRNA(Ile)-lysidine synthase [Caloramator quimbayensis]|uniref:tRNA(Ile)-lysidine synthase n=1 Tax=Caloramator quimbayensis TaxID=1147123 RepID=A0A1T4Y0T6_9CLOT|nr:tRNA lysidine(34) synthetase TilS [Caloramator quimbayensis]SKA95447.1 tRNA(Ile)-lysidine synthase [Caloramator quimbayensis]
MRKKVINTINKYNMISKGDKIVIGFSGGPDSTALIHVLHSLREDYDIKLYAAHINHMIRGDEAFRDEEYSKSLCEKLNVPFFLKREEVIKFAKGKKMSLEEAGRYIRYSFFSEVAKEVGANKIALAHNMNDQAETMIMRFFRGSGISGLCGIKPVRDNKYIRPIIECSREEIEEYCKVNNLNPIVDSTNEESIYIRNRIRLEVIPYIKNYFNSNIVESLYRSSEIIRDEENFIKNEAIKCIEVIKLRDGYDAKKFNCLHTAIKRRILRSIIEDLKGNLNGIEGKHIEECIEIIKNEDTGKRVSLPDNIECLIEYDIFKIKKKINVKNFESELEIPGKVTLDYENIEVYTKIIYKSNDTYKDTMFIKYFDYDKIKDKLCIRNRRDGDYMYPKGMEGRKKIKDIFIDKKIPREVREKIPLIALGNEILWIPKIRDTRNYKIDENTKRILEIKIKRSDIVE